MQRPLHTAAITLLYIVMFQQTRPTRISSQSICFHPAGTHFGPKALGHQTAAQANSKAIANSPRQYLSNVNAACVKLGPNPTTDSKDSCTHTTERPGPGWHRCAVFIAPLPHRPPKRKRTRAP